MAGLLDSPYAAPLLLNTGLGLLAGAQGGAPIGTNRFAPVAQGLNTGINQALQLKQAAMQKELFDLKKAQAEDEKRQRYAQAGARASLLGGYDPNTGVNWETGRQGGLLPDEAPTIPNGMLAGMPMSTLAQAFPDEFAKSLFTPAKAPTIREFKIGDRIVTKRYDASTDQWVDMETAPRWSAGEGGGGLTPTQQRENKEIAVARKEWERIIGQKYGGDARRMMDEVFTLDPITKGLVPRDKALGDLWAKAKERMTGEDQGYPDFIRQFMPPVIAPVTEPPRMRPDPPDLSQPGMAPPSPTRLQLPAPPMAAQQPQANVPAGRNAPFEADYNGRPIYSNDGQNWYYEDGTPVQ